MVQAAPPKRCAFQVFVHIEVNHHPGELLWVVVDRLAALALHLHDRGASDRERRGPKRVVEYSCMIAGAVSILKRLFQPGIEDRGDESTR